MTETDNNANIPADLRGRGEQAAWTTADGNAFAIQAEAEFWKGADDVDPKKAMRVGGLVSTESLDRDLEKVISSGLDFTECVKWGWYNDDHIKGTVVGVPEWAGYLRKGQTRPSGKPAPRDGWYTDGYLLDTARAKEIHETAVALQGTGRNLGFSIEGKILSKGNGVVQRALVREIAITKKPVNTDTFMDLPTLAKAISAGDSNPPVGGQPGDGGALIPQSLDAAQPRKRSTKMDKFEQFEADRKEKGLDKAAYNKALEKDDPEGAKLYNALCDANDVKKALADRDADVARLAKSVEALSAALDRIPADVHVDGGDLNKSIEDTGNGVDVGPFIAEVADQVARSSQNMAKSLESVGRATVATGALVARLEKALRARDAEMDVLKSTVTDMAKSLDALSNSPVVRRGATNLNEAAAMARNFGGKAADAGNGAMLKSLQGQWETLAGKGADKLLPIERQRMDQIGHFLSLAETGSVDAAITRARAAGLLA